jgi:hypothetical protein
MENEWNPKFKVGDCIEYNGDEMCISIVDREKKNYTFNNQGSASGYFVDNGFDRGDNKIEPAVLISSAAAGGRKRSRRHRKSKKSRRSKKGKKSRRTRKY